MNQDNQAMTQPDAPAWDRGEDEMQDSARRRQQQLLALLRGRWHWALLLGLLLGAGLSVAGYHSVTPMYLARGQISVDPARQPGSLAEREINYYDRFLSDQADRMGSQEVVEAALRHEDWRALGRGRHITNEAVRAFQRHLSVHQPTRSQALVIAFEDHDPEAARAGVAATIDAYHRIYSQRVSQSDARKVRTLQQRREDLEAEVERLQQERARLERAAGHGNITERRQHRQQQLWDTEALINQTQRQLELVESGEGEEFDLSVASVHQIAQRDQRMRQLLDDREQRQAVIQQHIEMGVGHDHRQMRRARAELDAVNRRIESYARRYREEAPIFGTGTVPGGGEADILGTPEELRTRLADLHQRHAELGNDLERLSEFERELSRLGNELERRQQQLAQQQNEIEQLQLQPSDAERIVTTNPPMTPTTPANASSRKQRTAFGAVGGLGMGLGLVMLLGLLDRRFRRIDDAELTLPRVRILGVLPALPDRKTDSEQGALAAHCIHHIRTMLQIGDGNLAANGADHHGRVITITSPSADAGKTSLVTALGVSFAASGERTLMIDCDVIGGGLSQRIARAARRPLEDVLRREQIVSESVITEALQSSRATGKPLDQTLMSLGQIEASELGRALRLQQEATLGLFDVCEGESFDACVAETDVDNLFLLPVGTATPDQAGNLSPEAVQRLLAKARGRFDTVLIDTGPILGSLEASMAVVEADDVVMVVSRGDQKQSVVRSIQTLEQLGGNFAGLVFNRASDHDIHHSSHASAIPEDSTKRLMSHELDAETSARFGPVGSAVTCYSSRAHAQLRRQYVNDRSDDSVAVHIDGDDDAGFYLLDGNNSGNNSGGNTGGDSGGNGSGNGERQRERRGRGRRADD